MPEWKSFIRSLSYPSGTDTVSPICAVQKVGIVGNTTFMFRRETIINPPKTDMVNEELNDENKVLKADDEVNDANTEKMVEIQTPDKRCTIKV